MPKRKRVSLDEIEIATFDFETDPFRYDRVPLPFAVGLRTVGNYEHCWGDAQTVIDWIIAKLKALKPGTIVFAHNGGKFDFHYILDHCEGHIMVIGARIVRAMIGQTEIRDSYALLPFALARYKKTEIEYWKMEAHCREEHKEEILSYLKDDCNDLYELVSGFIAEFGLSLTAAGAAIKELSSFHEIDKIGNENVDARFRKYYFGGRVECFRKGILPGNWRVYDVNSMYPHVMKNYLHPVSAVMNSYTGKHATTILDRCDYATIFATSEGALPQRNKAGGLYFPKGKGKFFASGHEIREAQNLGLLKIHAVDVAYKAAAHERFDTFVETFYSKRMLAKNADDHLRVLFYKLILNSAYGKLAQDPRNFRDWKIEQNECGGEDWVEEHVFDNGWIIYSRPTKRPHFTQRWNIAGAASITAAARSVLLRGIVAAKNPIYCDTDSLICEELDLPHSETELGAWKLEGAGNYAAIAGKKMYALFDDKKEIKIASKGVRATGADIVRLAQGEEINYKNEAPAFRLGRGPYDKVLTKSGKDARFIERKARMT